MLKRDSGSDLSTTHPSMYAKVSAHIHTRTLIEAEPVVETGHLLIDDSAN
jgi:hypothetical protein